VILEDSAAIIGLIIAGIGISLSETTGNMIFDSIGSLGMGIISMVFAFFLAKENKALLIGEAISKKDYRRIVELVHKIPGVNRLISLRTMYFAAEDVLVATDVSPKDGLTTDEIESVIDYIEQRVKQVIPYPAAQKSRWKSSKIVAVSLNIIIKIRTAKTVFLSSLLKTIRHCINVWQVFATRSFSKT